MGEAVLHGTWASGHGLRVWAEDPDLPTDIPPRRGRPAKVPRPRSHPFAARVAALAGRLDGAAGTVVLTLPSTALGPLASPRLMPSAQSAELVAPWEVPCLEIAPADVAAVLAALAAEDEPCDSVRWLACATELALELTGRGRVLPALVDGRSGTLEARWRPVLAEQDRQRAVALARAMPPVVSPDGGGGAAVLRDLVEVVVDATVRQAVAGAFPPPRRSRRALAPTPAQAWLSALGRDDATVDADPEQLTKLRAALEGWRQSAQVGPRAVRVCFRVDAPAEGDEVGTDHGGTPIDEAWTVRLLLQSVDDPSLLVPANELWAGGGALRALEAVDAHPHERLLEGLGRACRLWPELEPALDSPEPASLAMDARGAVRFLRGAAPLLEESGFGVLVPPWWKKGRTRLGVRLRAKSSRAGAVIAGGLGLDTLVHYEWQVALGDETLSAKELRELARLKQPLVRFRGSWVELREEDLADALALLSRRPATARAGDVLRAVLGVGGPESALPIIGVDADGWLGELLSGGDDARLAPVATPPAFNGVLRPYQERGLGWLSFLGALGLGSCLADDMGLGKTAQLLALLLCQPRPPALVVCPMSLVGNWQREASRFAPELRVHVHHGSERLSGADFEAEMASTDLVVTTYNLVARDIDTLSRVTWGRVVLDEAQNVKNSGARQTQAVRRLPATSRIALTGTPVENRLTELWSIMEFLNPGMLGSERAFRERFALPIERGEDDEAAEVLRRATGPFVLRRLKTDKSVIADLPDKLEMKVYCNLTREQATLYQAVVDDMLDRIDHSEGIERRGLVLATMLKLKQVCNHPAQFLGDGSRLDGRSGKLARLTETLEEVVAEGDRALVFTQFAEMGTMLVPHLEQHLRRQVLWLHGGTSKKARDEMVARFQSEGGPPVFVLSIKAGGTGLNLTAANHVVHFDRWWNPAVEDQATDRAFRIGQQRNVQVRKLVCVGTLEERIDAMIEQKRALAERIVGTGEGWLTELTTDALRAVVALTADAVAEA